MSWREANDQVQATGGMAGHDMATMPSQPGDPHAGHDKSEAADARPTAAMPVRPKPPSRMEGAADHAAHGARPVKDSTQKKVKE